MAGSKDFHNGSLDREDGNSKDDISPDREVQEVLRNQISAASGDRNGVDSSGKTHGKQSKHARKKRKSGEASRGGKEVGGIRWNDERRSAFTPYRPPTLLTNLSRGNVKTEPREVVVQEVTLYQLAGQGELTYTGLNGIDLGALDSEGLSLLMWAAAYGQAKAIDLLIQRGADPNQEGSENRTPLLFAAADGHFECIKRLLHAGADVNHHDENWNTALMYACSGDHPLCVNELLTAGAEITVENLCGDTAYDICCKQSDSKAKVVMDKHFLKVLSGRLNSAVPRMGLFSSKT